MPCFTLYLTNQDTTISQQNEINVRYYQGGSAPTGITANTRVYSMWNIDFDKMFRGENYNYKKCRLRVKAKMVNAARLATYARQVFGLTCGLSSVYGNRSTMLPTFLTIGSGIDAGIGTSVLDINVNTMEGTGVNTIVPTGSGNFTIAFNSPGQYNELLSRTNDFLTNFLLIFELYDPI